MTIAAAQPPSPSKSLTVTWDPLPDEFILENDPVDNADQPKLAAALSEALEMAGRLTPEQLTATNFAICATVDGRTIVKAPDWVYVPIVANVMPTRRSYTPNRDGTMPTVVIEFLSHTSGDEHSARPIYPYGKWFFYEQILQVPVYAIFEPDHGELEVYRLDAGHYQVQTAYETGRYWLAEMDLFLGIWQGLKGDRAGYWLRWWDEAGNLLLWGAEQVVQERQRTEQEHQRTEQLATYLRSIGINPDDIIAS